MTLCLMEPLIVPPQFLQCRHTLKKVRDSSEKFNESHVVYLKLEEGYERI